MDYGRDRTESLCKALERQGYNQMAARISEAAESGDLEVSYISIDSGSRTRGLPGHDADPRISTTFEITISTDGRYDRALGESRH